MNGGKMQCYESLHFVYGIRKWSINLNNCNCNFVIYWLRNTFTRARTLVPGKDGGQVTVKALDRQLSGMNFDFDKLYSRSFRITPLPDGIIQAQIYSNKFQNTN